jgi:transposase
MHTREELPEEMRAVLTMMQAGQSQAAIAQALAIPLGTVKSRRSRLQARGLLEKPPPRGGVRVGRGWLASYKNRLTSCSARSKRCGIRC